MPPKEIAGTWPRTTQPLPPKKSKSAKKIVYNTNYKPWNPPHHIYELTSNIDPSDPVLPYQDTVYGFERDHMSTAWDRFWLECLATLVHNTGLNFNLLIALLRNAIVRKNRQPCEAITAYDLQHADRMYFYQKGVKDHKNGKACSINEVVVAGQYDDDSTNLQLRTSTISIECDDIVGDVDVKELVDALCQVKKSRGMSIQIHYEQSPGKWFTTLKGRSDSAYQSNDDDDDEEEEEEEEDKETLGLVRDLENVMADHEVSKRKRDEAEEVEEESDEDEEEELSKQKPAKRACSLYELPSIAKARG